MTKEILEEENIILNQEFCDKWDAIRATGSILVNNGYVKEEYIEDMIEREKQCSVYIGNKIAIPHGLSESSDKIISSGISFLQIPKGVTFGDKKAYILIGIAGKGNEHIKILSGIAAVYEDMRNINKLIAATDKAEVYDILTGADNE